MRTLSIHLNDNKTTFFPGDEISGAVSWYLDSSPKALDLRLFWYTEGIGIPDTGIVDVVRFDNPEQEGRREFRFVLPNGPYSFSGELITLKWALELVLEPSRQVGRVDIVMSPTGGEISLPRLESQLSLPSSRD